tara:strand:+ start:4919 stop:5128 length:210 start_codon:yes stop_codon:yes gene_type:complete
MKRMNQNIIDELARKAIESASPLSNDLERFCWIILHEYIHGFRPSEYDIRDVEEDQYLVILQRAKELRK